MKDRESGEFLLQKDPSVQKIEKKDHMLVRSSQGTTLKQQEGSSKALLKKKSSKH